MHLHKQLTNATVVSLSSAFLKAHSFPKEQQKKKSPILVPLHPSDSHQDQGTGAAEKNNTA